MNGRARSVEAEYARLAPVYDTRWAAYIERTVALTAARLPREAPETALDVGCGTGAMLDALAARYPGAALAGLDPSPAMLAQARARQPGHVVLAAGRAEALPFGDARFDLLVSTSALHFFADIAAATAEMQRVMRPGGRMLVLDWCADFLTMRLYDAFARALGRANFTMLDTAAYSRLLHASGFDDIAAETHRLDALWGVMVVQACKPRAADEDEGHGNA